MLACLIACHFLCHSVTWMNVSELDEYFCTEPFVNDPSCLWLSVGGSAPSWRFTPAWVSVPDRAKIIRAGWMFWYQTFCKWTFMSLTPCWGLCPWLGFHLYLLPREGLCPCLDLSKQIRIAVGRGRNSSRVGAPHGVKAPSSNALRTSLSRIFGRVAH